MELRQTVIMGVLFVAAGALILSMILPGTVRAHCDTMNGPVISQAKAAIEKGDVRPVLKWVKKDKEADIREAFAQTVAVRAKGPEAKELADRYFLETLVRLHREGEGAPYTGLKDEPVEPIVAMADKALADGSADEMIQKISAHMAAAIREKFNKAKEAARNKETSVEAGRQYVEAYVTYMHFVEGIHSAIVSVPGHSHEVTAEVGADEHEPTGHEH
ncbi:MAG TPA: hypothetical protein ENN81_08470 [Phycisphaerales bacterium]|nr:hypothetical protein [Phycisphaerales bacterium]